MNDTATGNLEVHATGPDGSLEEKYFRSGAWQNLGGPIRDP